MLLGIVELFDERLAMFDLIQKRHIVGITTEGAEIMQKMGRLMGVEKQLCLSHGIHLLFQQSLLNESQGRISEMLIDLVDVLEVMRIGSVNISVNDSSLLDANQIMEFAFANLQDNQSIIA